MRAMTHVAVATMLGLSATGVEAQSSSRIEPTLVVGVERSRFNGKDAAGDLSSIVRPTVGAMLRFSGDTEGSLETGVRYSIRGFESKGATQSYVYTSNWIAIPALLRVTPGKSAWKPLFVGGGEFAFRVGCGANTSGASSEKFDCDAVDKTFETKHSAFSVVLGGGVERTSQRLITDVSLRWNRGLTSVTKHVNSSNENHLDSFVLQLELARGHRK